MRFLVVTADDFGADPATNAAIVRCAEEGIVTRTSVFATGQALADAAARRPPALGTGVHLNLTEGRSLTGRVPGATDDAGRFRGLPAVLAAAVGGRLDLAAARAELDAQVKRALEVGFEPLHLDGHHHVHVFPRLLPIVLDLAADHGIGTVRLPLEPPLLRHRGARAKRALVSCLARGAGAAITARGLTSTDHFRGFSLFNRLRHHHRRLIELLQHLPDGSTELMVHPRGGVRGEAEVASLVDPRTREALERLEIRLAAASRPALHHA